MTKSLFSPQCKRTSTATNNFGNASAYEAPSFSIGMRRSPIQTKKLPINADFAFQARDGALKEGDGGMRPATNDGHEAVRAPDGDSMTEDSWTPGFVACENSGPKGILPIAVVVVVVAVVLEKNGVERCSLI